MYNGNRDKGNRFNKARELSKLLRNDSIKNSSISVYDQLLAESSIV